MGLASSKINRVSKMANMESVQDYVKDMITKEKVVVFSKTYCPYCKLAKDVFNKVNQPINVVELDEREDGLQIQESLAAITGFKTVPQVFINGSCVGGGSDVKALHDSGKLENLLISP